MLTKSEWLHKVLWRARLRVTKSNDPATPAFVFGEMRSGTNMLIRALNKSANTECYNENDDEAFIDYELKPNDVIEGLINKSYARVVGFKPIADSHRARDIVEHFPNAKAVWIYRRYQDAVVSALKLWKQHRKYLELVLFSPEKASWRAKNLTNENRELIRYFYEKGVSDASSRALIWYLRNNLYYQQNLDDHPNVFLVNYERIVSEPAVRVPQICKFVGCEYHERMSQGIFSSSVHKSFKERLDPEIAERCEKLFERLEASLATQNT
jgi:hypothetical protein